ncbi:HEPN domain-containing protein [Bernardetia litoralis DSM 6794]|uniref:HEPN domain-containing protein n=1 Tax=Bernardetia litoralis (strain ATCC 23117 / DSM 6794 / NBRC 15988 / NCIMB 1366 / Fx l1 / Sio-4) TaxID=880071 RepID=I4AKG0_BERLS|nr:HEPN domain-containing protein [Bernardetia litoralis]AFM04445.1 HEPN domain-containing protein [Bernardetia litoralis DSM 6794]
MQNHLEQAKHNQEFLSEMETAFPQKFFDWKITISFYVAIHYLQALADHKGIEIGQTHNDIERNVNPNSCWNPRMQISTGAWREYKNLFQYSLTARYDGIEDKEIFEELKRLDYIECIKHLDNFKKYIKSQGLNI